MIYSLVDSSRHDAGTQPRPRCRYQHERQRGARDGGHGAEDGDDRAWEGDDGKGLKMHARLEPLGMFFSRFSYLTNVYLSIDYTYDDHHHT